MNTFLLIAFLFGVVGFIVKKAYDSFAGEFERGRACGMQGSIATADDTWADEMHAKMFRDHVEEIQNLNKNISPDSTHPSNVNISPASPVNNELYYQDIKGSLRFEEQ